MSEGGGHPKIPPPPPGTPTLTHPRVAGRRRPVWGPPGSPRAPARPGWRRSREGRRSWWGGGKKKGGVRSVCGGPGGRFWGSRAGGTWRSVCCWQRRSAGAGNAIRCRRRSSRRRPGINHPRPCPGGSGGVWGGGQRIGEGSGGGLGGSRTHLGAQGHVEGIGIPPHALGGATRPLLPRHHRPPSLENRHLVWGWVTHRVGLGPPQTPPAPPKPPPCTPCHPRCSWSPARRASGAPGAAGGSRHRTRPGGGQRDLGGDAEIWGVGCAPTTHKACRPPQITWTPQKKLLTSPLPGR